MLVESVQIINFIMTRPLQSRVFEAICECMDSHQTIRLLHTDVRWLSRGNVLVRIVELLSYFLDQKLKLADRFRNNVWLYRRTYLAAIP